MESLPETAEATLWRVKRQSSMPGTPLSIELPPISSDGPHPLISGKEASILERLPKIVYLFQIPCSP